MEARFPNNILNEIRTRMRRVRQIRAIRSWGAADRARSEFYRQFIEPGDLVFDVGANVGNRTKVFAHLNAKVIAFEPQPECVSVLLRAFGHKRDVTIVPKGLAAEADRLPIHISDQTAISTMSRKFISATKAAGRFTNRNWDTEILVEVTTMDQAIAEFGVPRFVKIDVEGYELDVLRGLSQKIEALSFEFAPECFDVALGCVRKLTTLSRYKFQLSLGEGLKWELADWVDEGQIIEILAQAPRLAFGDVYARIQL